MLWSSRVMPNPILPVKHPTMTNPNLPKTYLAPDLTLIEVAVSCGFATSRQTPEYEEGGPDIVLP